MDIYDKLAATVDRTEETSFPVQATSGIWEAKDNNTGKDTSVLIFLSHRYRSSDKVKESLPVEDQNTPHHLVAAVEDAKNRGIPMEFDGLPAQLIQRYAETTHELAAYNNHTADYSKTMLLQQKALQNTPFPFHQIPNGPQNLNMQRYDQELRTSKEVLFTALIMTLSQSAGLSGLGTSIHATDNYICSNSKLEECVESAIKVYKPDQHKAFSKAREPGRVVRDEAVGCFIGQAVIFKLLLYLHCNEGDKGMSVSFPARRFKGGCLIIPQFETELWPGDLVLIYVNSIWHTVDIWEATKLKDKEAGWAADTMHGKLPTCQPVHHVQK
ncbi:hypothetical protein AAF712_010942 [Marasmius tenuissimus]|uniref:Uncharacterized protein n=1 Tax=Marasmius tenuissimus TaxID=585030 RepID=A0ABR2ZKU1_9AGAR